MILPRFSTHSNPALVDTAELKTAIVNIRLRSRYGAAP